MNEISLPDDILDWDPGHVKQIEEKILRMKRKEVGLLDLGLSKKAAKIIKKNEHFPQTIDTKLKGLTLETLKAIGLDRLAEKLTEGWNHD